MGRYRKNVKRIDPRYFLHEKKEMLHEAPGQTPEAVADRVSALESDRDRESTVIDFLNMRDGSTEVTSYYDPAGPTWDGHVDFATQVLQLLGEI